MQHGLELQSHPSLFDVIQVLLASSKADRAERFQGEGVNVEE